MGITNIFTYLKKEVPDLNQKCKLIDFKGKKLAIDTSIFLYKFSYGNEKGSLMTQFCNLYIDLKKNGIEPIFVFDGSPPKLKDAIKEKRNKKRKEMENKIDCAIEELKCKKIKLGLDASLSITEKYKPKIHQNDSWYGNDDDVVDDTEINWKEIALSKDEYDISNLKKTVINIIRDDVINTKMLLLALGANVIQAEGEGEATCALLNRLQIVDGVVSEDSDVIAFGGLKLIRFLGSTNNREDKMVVYDTSHILRHLKLSPKEFVEMAILCKTDFTNDCKIKGIGPKKAHEKILLYKNIESVIAYFNPAEVKKHTVPANFCYREARSLFHYYLDAESLPINTITMPQNDKDFDAVIKCFDFYDIPDAPSVISSIFDLLDSFEVNDHHDISIDSLDVFFNSMTDSDYNVFCSKESSSFHHLDDFIDMVSCS